MREIGVIELLLQCLLCCGKCCDDHQNHQETQILNAQAQVIYIQPKPHDIERDLDFSSRDLPEDIIIEVERIKNQKANTNYMNKS